MPSSVDYDMSYDKMGVMGEMMLVEENSPTIGEEKVIKTGTLSLHMEDVRSSVEEIKTTVTSWGGETLNSNVSLYGNSYYGTMTVRVPSDQFDAAFSALKEMALYVESEYTNADNVTEQYMDLEARLNNLNEEEAQYLAILDKATTVEEILQVTDYLSQVRYEIESAETQLKYYDTNVDYSTITLTLTEDEDLAIVNETWEPKSTFNEALSDWYRFLQEAVDFGIYAVIFAWPLLLLAVLAWLWKRRRSQKKHK